MNVKQIIADRLAEAELGVVNKTIYAGRVPETKSAGKKMQIGMQFAAGGGPVGGNIAKLRTRYMVVVYAYAASEAELQAADIPVQHAITSLPRVNEKILIAKVSAMQEAEPTQTMLFAGAWLAEIITSNS